MVIVFANQKGGVGKTTLCMLFANYLTKLGKNVLVLDVDRQRSLCAQRKSDAAAFNDQEEDYNVEEADVEDVNAIEHMMQAAKEIDGIVLIDTPGNVTEDGLIPIFSGADAILCPYQYEKRCLDSTGVFIQVIEALKESIPTMRPALLYIPNHVDSRIGTKEEQEAWMITDNIFRKYGSVQPRIPYKSSIMRCNTYALTKAQEQDVKVCFDSIIAELSLLAQ